MKPVQTPNCNLVYKLPGGSDENDLPVERQIIGWFIVNPETGEEFEVPDGDPRIIHSTEDHSVDHVEPQAKTAIVSTWQLDTDELAAVTGTGLVQLTIWGEPIPPVALAVVTNDEALALGDDEHWEPPIARKHLRRALHLLHHWLVKEGYDAASPEDIESGLNECLLATASGRKGNTDGK